MSRPIDPEIRRKLRDKAVDYVMRHGIWDLSLRPLAKALNTNARMLVYHFGSREQLMRAILEGLREQEDARVKAWFQAHSNAGPQTLRQFVKWYWRRLSSARARPAVKLTFEVYALALRDPDSYPGILEDPVQYWRQLAERSNIKGDRAATIATLLLAATRGLLLDVVATGDHRRINRGFKQILALIPEASD